MITNADIETFILLINEARDRPDTSSFPVLSEFAHLQTENCSYLYTDTLSAEIRTAIVVPSTDPAAINLRELHKALIRRSVFYGGSFPYHEIPRAIFFGVNETYFRSFIDREAWLRAIRIALIIRNTQIYSHLPNHGYERDVSTTQAACRLRDQNYRLRLEGQYFLFEEGELDRCCSDLDRMIAAFGGAQLLASLFRGYLRPLFVRGRYMLGRLAKPVPDPDRGPAIPFGYLLNLAIKHMKQSGSLFNNDQFVRIIHLARDIVAILDLEAYSSFENMFISHRNLADFIQDAVLGDFCLSFRQLRVTDALFMFEHLFDWVNQSEMRANLGWTIDDALNLAKAALTATSPEEVNIVFNIDVLQSRSGLNHRLIKQMLPYFTYKTFEVNEKFLTPLNAEHANFEIKPFIWKSGNRTLLLSSVIGSIGFYESIVSALRTLWPDQVDNQIGISAEKMLAESFRNHGIQPSVVSKKYRIGPNIYECDLVIEGPEAVILFEVKKKPLTRLARTGNVLVAIRDLVIAMLSAQLQLSRHEDQLLKNGKITFLDRSEVQLNGRQIERIAVTLFDWGSTQDRLSSDNILKILATAQVGSNSQSPYDLEIQDNIREALRKFQTQQQMLSGINLSSAHPFFNCLFLSIPLISYLLDGVRTVDDFYRKIKIQNSIISGAADPYFIDSRFS